MTGRILLASVNLSLFLALRLAHGQQQSAAPTSGPTVGYDLTLVPIAGETDEPRATPAPTSRSTVAPARETPAPTSSLNVSTPAAETPAPTLSSNAAAPARETPEPTRSWHTSASPTAGPTVVPTSPPTVAPTLVPTAAPTTSPTAAPTTSPTAAPTTSPTAFCERPYKSSNESDIPCVEMVTDGDKERGVGASYDEEGCEQSSSVVGCHHGNVTNCRLCVFNRGLYSTIQGYEAPFVDCPCCVPDTYEMGGDIDCEFEYSSPPLPTPAPVSVEGDTSTPEPAQGERDTDSTIPMEPCETGAGGDSSASLCVDIANTEDLENGIGTYYESGCEGVGCDITNEKDCRQCVFDSEAYTASEGTLDLVDCPCCVPITYKLRPDSSECVWPPTPSPTAAPTTVEERNGAARPGIAVGGPLVVIAVVVGGLVGLG